MKQAVIREVVIFFDALNVELIDLLKDTLTRIKYNKNEIKNKLDELGKVNPELAAQIEDFRDGWLLRWKVRNTLKCTGKMGYTFPTHPTLAKSTLIYLEYINHSFFHIYLIQMTLA